jgi:hypothetical protein
MRSLSRNRARPAPAVPIVRFVRSASRAEWMRSAGARPFLGLLRNAIRQNLPAPRGFWSAVASKARHRFGLPWSGRGVRFGMQLRGEPKRRRRWRSAGALHTTLAAALPRWVCAVPAPHPQKTADARSTQRESQAGMLQGHRASFLWFWLCQVGTSDFGPPTSDFH